MIQLIEVWLSQNKATIAGRLESWSQAHELILFLLLIQYFFFFFFKDDSLCSSVLRVEMGIKMLIQS